MIKDDEIKKQFIGVKQADSIVIDLKKAFRTIPKYPAC